MEGGLDQMTLGRRSRNVLDQSDLLIPHAEAKGFPSSAVAKMPTTNVSERVIGIAPAPLLPGETGADYLGVAQRIVAVAQPKDAIEEFLPARSPTLPGRFFVCVGEGCLVESLCWQRRKENTFDDWEQRIFLCPSWGGRLCSEVGQRGCKRTRRIYEILKKAELTMDEVVAETFAKQIDYLERLDRMLASAEARRNNALREIDRHRASARATARQAIDDVQDAAFRDVETGEEGGVAN